MQESSSLSDMEITLGKNLKSIRNHLGLTRLEFASILNIPPATLKNYELLMRRIPASLLLQFNNHKITKVYFGKLISDSLVKFDEH